MKKVNFEEEVKNFKNELVANIKWSLDKDSGFANDYADVLVKFNLITNDDDLEDELLTKKVIEVIQNNLSDELVIELLKFENQELVGNSSNIIEILLKKEALEKNVQLSGDFQTYPEYSLETFNKQMLEDHKHWTLIDEKTNDFFIGKFGIIQFSV